MSLGTLLAIVGPTAAGKTALAVQVCERLGGEIISCDSAQVFRGLDIGTAKPSLEELRRAQHHLIDVIDPNTQWTAAHFADRADQAIREVRARGRTPVLVGGAGLWFRALLRGVFEAPEISPEIRADVRERIIKIGSPAVHGQLAAVDPEAARRLHPNDSQRVGRALEFFLETGRSITSDQDRHGFREPRYELLAFALDRDRDELRGRIAERTRVMYASGLVTETRGAISAGARTDGPGLSIIGYRDAAAVIAGSLSEADAIAKTTLETQQYAKRQRNWFRGESEIRWISAEIGAAEIANQFEAWLDHRKVSKTELTTS